MDIGEIIVICIAAGIALLFFFGAIVSGEEYRKYIAKNAALEKLITEMGITKSVDTEFHFSTGYYRFIADDETRTVYISEGIEKAEFISIPYALIKGVRVVGDEWVTGKGTRNTGKSWTEYSSEGNVSVFFEHETYEKKSVFLYSVILRTDDPDLPEYDFDLIKMKTSTTDIIYTRARFFALDVKSAVDKIVRANKKAALQRRSAPASVPARASSPAKASPSAAPEDITAKLRKLKELHNDELITDEEYASKKAELLKQL